MDKEQIFSLLEEAFSAIQYGASTKHEFSRTLKLMGEGGIFDSLDTMLFLDKVDEVFAQHIGRELDLVDSDAFSQEESPFIDMIHLADYLESILNVM